MLCLKVKPELDKHKGKNTCVCVLAGIDHVGCNPPKWTGKTLAEEREATEKIQATEALAKEALRMNLEQVS
jgi:hypothetical protein